MGDYKRLLRAFWRPDVFDEAFLELLKDLLNDL